MSWGKSHAVDKMFWIDPIGCCLSPVESRISPTRYPWRGEVSWVWMLLSLALACFHSIITKCLFVFIPVASLSKQFMLEWNLSEASPVTRKFSHSCRESGVMTLEASGDWRAMKQSSTLFSKCHVMVTIIPQSTWKTYFNHACLKSVISVICSTVLKDLEHAC